jgi:hypothetical protein
MCMRLGLDLARGRKSRRCNNFASYRGYGRRAGRSSGFRLGALGVPLFRSAVVTKQPPLGAEWHREHSKAGQRVADHRSGFAAIRIDASCRAAALAASKLSAVPFTIKSQPRAGECRTSYRTSHVGTPFWVNTSSSYSPIVLDAAGSGQSEGSGVQSSVATSVLRALRLLVRSVLPASEHRQFHS